MQYQSFDEKCFYCFFFLSLHKLFLLTLKQISFSYKYCDLILSVFFLLQYFVNIQHIIFNLLIINAFIFLFFVLPFEFIKAISYKFDCIFTVMKSILIKLKCFLSFIWVFQTLAIIVLYYYNYILCKYSSYVQI